MSPRGAVQLFIMLVLGAIMLQMLTDIVRPLLPWMLAVAVIAGLAWVGMVVYRRRQNW